MVHALRMLIALKWKYLGKNGNKVTNGKCLPDINTIRTYCYLLYWVSTFNIIPTTCSCDY